MKVWPYIPAAAALAAALFLTFYFLQSHPGGVRSGMLSPVAWQRMASPGELSEAHAFLEHNCAACHTAVRGVEASNCTACHANEHALLQRQPTAFHADIGSCAECHVEHRGIGSSVSQMDHAAFARLSLRQLGRAGGQTSLGPHARHDDDAKRVASWIREIQRAPSSRDAYPNVSATQAVLNCAVCHRNQDTHREFFGTDCAQCHATTGWSIAEFRHPPPSSTDCAQCHQAPPSHYMMHFEMVSKKVAGQEHASVSQCYVCHQTTSWNDIKGVGWYKHH